MQMQQTLGTVNTVGPTLDAQASAPSLSGLPRARRAASLAGRSLQATTSSPATSRDVPAPSYLRNAAVAFAALLGAITFVYHPDVLDRPVTRFVNHWAHRSPTLDLAFWSLDGCFVFSGFALTALIWYCWFGNTDEDSRARILVGALLAFPAGAISRLLQHTVPSHPRPFYDAVLRFRTPYLMQEKPLNTWNSFPSDHATVFAALLTVICIARPKLSKFVIPYFILVESARIYSGAHYPSDLLGGAALGAMVIWAVQAPRILALGRRLLRFEITSPALFYMCAFFFTTCTATLFLEIRTVGSYFFHLHHG